jgi:hypothetical protein
VFARLLAVATATLIAAFAAGSASCNDPSIVQGSGGNGAQGGRNGGAGGTVPIDTWLPVKGGNSGAGGATKPCNSTDTSGCKVQAPPHRRKVTRLSPTRQQELFPEA